MQTLSVVGPRFSLVAVSFAMHDESAAAADAVRDACRRSLVSHGVRVYVTTVREAEGGWTDATRWEVGVADPAARRLELEGFVTSEDPVIECIRAAVRQAAPELVDQDPWRGAGPHRDGERILVARDIYERAPDGVWKAALPRRLWAIDGLWVLEAALGTTTARVAGEVDVRGQRCRRYTAMVAPGDAVARPGVELVDELPPGDDFHRMLVEVCVGPTGLVHRIACAPTKGTRFRPGVLLGVLSRIAKPPESIWTADERRRWTVLELWDYGITVKVSAPSRLARPAQPTTTRQVMADLWRARRHRRQSGR